ncbi:hypothetical protein [Photobacterium lutimaris]|uniref:DUF2441 domain-containing protein n=1 Tax=Photobacterium lutimaris TaxID=388278 RepID=A0A2T3ITQ9_9GAMM|nr:hypothetical protein [Photobacterium lutimaris]PSU31747.1 hypothetical protein C9I99_21420 [Photobacterium lutimaris]TDR72606.1 hypothetical protein DFP78_11382 [Photobacterium lutimaris]
MNKFYRAIKIVDREIDAMEVGEVDSQTYNYSATVFSHYDWDEEELDDLAKDLKADPDIKLVTVFEGCAIPWEMLYEIVRREEFEHCPSRTEVIFAFTNPDSAVSWARRPGQTSRYLIVELIPVEKAINSTGWHKFDTNHAWLDKATEECSFREAREYIRNYWLQTPYHELYSSPESLLTGKFAIKVYKSPSTTVVANQENDNKHR